MVSNSFENYSVLILAGGESIRMQSPKAWLKYNDTSFLEHIINIYNSVGIEKITVVLNNSFYNKEWETEIRNIEKKSNIILNDEQDKGRIHSIKLGLRNLQKSKFTFIHNVDNPFVEQMVIEHLILNAIPSGVSIPVYREKKGHPILISDNIKNEILKNGHESHTLRDILLGFPQKKVVVNSNSILQNINTQEDFKISMNEHL